MKTKSFENLYEEYERQRKEIRDFIVSNKNPRTPKPHQDTKDNE